MASLDHLNLTVEDLNKSLFFYKDLFGFETVEQGDHKGTPYAIVRSQDSMLCMYEIPGKDSPESSATHKIYHFGLRVADKEAWEKTLSSHPVQPHLVWDYPYSKSWYLYDPSGHEIEVSYWHNNQINF